MGRELDGYDAKAYERRLNVQLAKAQKKTKTATSVRCNERLVEEV